MNTQMQKSKAIRFRELHHQTSPLLLPNAWDAASAALLEQAGFQAVATTSSGLAASLGYLDGQQIRREMLIEAVARIARVISVPLSVDLEAGYGSNIEGILETVKAVIAAGAVGINIEDSTKPDVPSLVDVSFQVELLHAIRETASQLDIPLVINARTDVFLLSAETTPAQIEEAIRRLRAYKEAGADSLFPISVSNATTIATLVQAIDAPMNVLAGRATPTVLELARLGVKRISFGSGLLRATLAHLQRIAHELLEQGTYSNLLEMISTKDLKNLLERNKA